MCPTNHSTDDDDRECIWLAIDDDQYGTTRFTFSNKIGLSIGILIQLLM